MSDGAKKPNRSSFGDDNQPEPELELTLTGINQPSWFGQVVHSGLNVISNVGDSLTGKRKKAPPPRPTDMKGMELDPEPPKPSANAYNPSWQAGNFADPQIEHTNFTTAIGEFKRQQEQMPRNRVNQQIIIRRPKTSMPFVYKLAIFSVIVALGTGTFIYLDKKYNVRQLVKELKDPTKTKLKVKRKPTVSDE